MSKERDWETGDAESGYDAFGARYYSSIFGHWLSVDPLASVYILKRMKPKWKTSSEKFASITTALESVSLISKVAGENESKGIKNSSPYTEIVLRQDDTRCPVAEKPQPLKLDNNNL